MKLSMNQATCLEKSSLEKDLELCEKYGYDMIEPRTMDGIPNYLKNHTIDELAAWFKSHKVKPLAFNTLCFFNNRTPEDYQKVLQELRQMCEHLLKLMQLYSFCFIITDILQKHKVQ